MESLQFLVTGFPFLHNGIFGAALNLLLLGIVCADAVYLMLDCRNALVLIRVSITFEHFVAHSINECMLAFEQLFIEGNSI